MEKTIQVHLKTTVWKRITIAVPEDEDPKEFIEDLMDHDPTCLDHPKEEEEYHSETEEALEGEYYLPDEDYEDEYDLFGTSKFPTLEANNLMVLLDNEEDNPMRALFELQQQAREDGDVMADKVVQMNRHLKETLSVTQLLEIVRKP